MVPTVVGKLGHVLPPAWENAAVSPRSSQGSRRAKVFPFQQLLQPDCHRTTVPSHSRIPFHPNPEGSEGGVPIRACDSGRKLDVPDRTISS